MVYVYILELIGSKWYIGRTTNISKRPLVHFKSMGAGWTKMYEPIRIHKVIENCDAFDEDKWTKKYMAEYGIDNVRGGSYCTTTLPTVVMNMLEKEIKNAEDRCFKCGKSGHFANKCEVETLKSLNKVLGEENMRLICRVRELEQGILLEQTGDDENVLVPIIARNGTITVRMEVLRQIDAFLRGFNKNTGTVVCVDNDVNEVNTVVGYVTEGPKDRINTIVRLCGKYGIEVLNLNLEWGQLIEYCRWQIDKTFNSSRKLTIKGYKMPMLSIVSKHKNSGTTLHESYYEYTDDSSIAVIKIRNEKFKCKASTREHNVNGERFDQPVFTLIGDDANRVYDILKGNYMFMTIPSIFLNRLLRLFDEEQEFPK